MYEPANVSETCEGSISTVRSGLKWLFAEATKERRISAKWMGRTFAVYTQVVLPGALVLAIRQHAAIADAKASII